MGVEFEGLVYRFTKFEAARPERCLAVVERLLQLLQI